MNTTIIPQETSVALISGGKSGEREISLVSGSAVYDALIDAGFSVTQIDPAKKEDLVTLVSEDFNVAFLALHGKLGEDGTIQGMLEILGIPYTGPGVWSSATAIDKPKTKIIYEQVGVPIPRAILLHSPDQMTAEDIEREFDSSCVITAATEGSALGVYLCNGREEIESALKNVFEIDDQALVETMIQGDEYTVGVLGTEDPQALPVIQIVPSMDSAFRGRNHAPKMTPTSSVRSIGRRTEIRVSLFSHKGLEYGGFATCCLMSNFYALETNTIPGMTPISLLPDAARVCMDFTQCIALIETRSRTRARTCRRISSRRSQLPRR